MQPADRVIVALDVPNRADAKILLGQLGDAVRWVKVGLELFCAEGPAFVRELSEQGLSVMLDLKLHDIPKTVERAASRVAGLGAKLLTVHASGGHAMLDAARQGAGDKLGLLGVTVLTSMSEADLREAGTTRSLGDQVEALAKTALDANLDGVVASPHEVKSLRSLLPSSFELVIPGIRPKGSALGDQTRVGTPSETLAAGATRLVVGRPIRDAAAPRLAFESILEEIT